MRRWVEAFEAYLSRARVGPEHRPHFVSRAERFAREAAGVPLEALGPAHVERFLRDAAARGESARELRNLRLSSEALLRFVASGGLAPRGAERPSDGASAALTEPRARSERVPFIRPVEIEGLGGCRALDLSEGGIFLETMHPLPRGTLFRMGFRLHASDARPLTTLARVVHEQPGIGLGMAFVQMPSEDRSALDRYLASAAPA